VKYLGENVYSATLSISDGAGTVWGSNMDVHNEKLATSWQSHVFLCIGFSVINHGISMCNINAPEVLVCYMCTMMCNSTDRQRVGRSYKILRYTFWHISVTFTSVVKFIVCVNV
jgi:hypothetical protein